MQIKYRDLSICYNGKREARSTGGTNPNSQPYGGNDLKDLVQFKIIVIQMIYKEKRKSLFL